MHTLVVLSALIAVAVASPGLLHGGLGYQAVATHAAVAVPAAVSHQSRTDVIRKPIVAAYAAPAILAAPTIVKSAYSAPVVAQTVFKAAPAIATYAASPVVAAYSAHVPAFASYAAAPLAYKHAW